MDIKKQLYLAGIVPVIKIDDAANAVPLAEALRRGGLNCAEVTFRTAAAAEAIKNITEAFPDMLVGAGTVLTNEQVDTAVAAGAQFIVSPGFNPETVKYCISKNIPILPGCSTCGEMEQAMALGLDTVKFFPAEAAGGVTYLKSVSAPYKQLKFMPTGGIDKTNIMNYLSLPNVVACGGSFMVKDEFIKNGDFEKITALTKDAVLTMLGLSIVHVGINSENEAEAKVTVEALCKLFGLLPDVHKSATFAGKLFEVMHTPFRGTHGHVAIGTNNPDRARAYLEGLGFEFDESSATYADNGRLKVCYLKNEIGGFAFHLLQK